MSSPNNQHHQHARNDQNPRQPQPAPSLTPMSNDDDPLSVRKLGSAWRKLGDDQHMAAYRLKTFGQPLGEDLSDVTNKLGELFLELAKAITSFSNQYVEHHVMMSCIAQEEASLSTDRKERQELRETIRDLEESETEDKVVLKLLKELDKKDISNKTKEMEARKIQRTAVYGTMHKLFNSMDELASKVSMITTFGKELVDELPIARDYERTTRILERAKKDIAELEVLHAKIRLPQLPSHHVRFALDAGCSFGDNINTSP